MGTGSSACELRSDSYMPKNRVELTSEQAALLNRRVRSRATHPRDRLRARIVLARARGEKLIEVAERLDISLACAAKWSRRFTTLGMDGLKDVPGRGRKPWLPQEAIDRVLTIASRPPEGRAGWTRRQLATQVGISSGSVRRILQAGR